VGDKKNVISDDKMPWSFVNVPSGATVNVKNLGAQIQWHMVFYIEYFGPLFILPLLYFFGKREEYTEVQHIAVVLGVLHYLKRELETAFVHVFSRTSMPTKRCLINCTHYWILFALFNGIELFFFPKGHTYDQPILIAIVVAWALFEFLNLQCHLVLSSFRKAPKQKAEGYENQSKRRGIPRGWGFGLVSCANYFWESMAWVSFCVLTQGWTSLVFVIFSVYQMLEWAIKKHKIYKKEFGDQYPKGRKAMFPFII